MMVVICFKEGNAGYNRIGDGLNEFPGDIPTQETRIFLGSNNLVTIPSSQLVNLTRVEWFIVNDNKLIAFPDFRPISASLTTLSVEENLITTIPSEIIRELTALLILHLEGQYA